ncbi:MoaD/ThiS family protein [Nocardioides sp.]|uniref:MoaD/ThiS family protein n=1 Tax=Nocardioides sp. TaxID=35761 RepID=UPI002629FE3A|nr:MoaD/ThiS family protein [Nocardioides sp.]MCW2736193.1 thiamine biosynthesis protein ThiS [Nocardioides sp.]
MVTVRYWAGARAAAGTAEDRFDVVGEVTLDGLVALVLERHPDDRMARTVAVCSVLVGERPVRSQDPATVIVTPGDVVELLPPFAGG